METRGASHNLMNGSLKGAVLGIARGAFMVMLGCAGVLAYGPVAYAARADEGAPTFALDITYGLSSTYKSKYVAMNDTGSHTMYSLGGNAGASRDLGFMVRTDTQTTNFLLNSSKMTTVWQDSILRYSIGPVYLGINFCQLDLLANKEGVATIDAAGSGMGGNLGVYYDFEKTGLFYLDVTTATIAKARNSLDLVVKGGARTDIDLGLGYHITKESFIFLLGYKQRTFALSADTSYAEAIMTTYIGLRTALFF